MTQRSLAVLIVLNVVLLAAIALTFGPVEKAQAQLGGGSYLMLAGETAQSNQMQVVYVMDTRTGRVVGFTVNSATKRLELVGARDLSKDADNLGGGR